jgi:hypothetical protein
MKKNKEEKDTEESGKEEEKSPESNSKQLYWILGVMAGLILTFVLTTFIIQSFKSFNYEGMKFTKENFGNIPIYVYSYSALMSTTGNVVNTGAVQVILRGDPRKNNVLIEGGQIEFPSDRLIYISINTTGLKCNYTAVAAASLSGFLTSNGFKIKGAVPDEKEANESSIQFASCKSKPNNPVIEIKSAEKTHIQVDGNCFVIEVANCEILQAVEKFEVQMIADAKKRAS